ncbi:Fungal Zn(2)-Cys(6) binuclear cluster domain [Rhizoctonia solani]|uniref:Fungal Zn(2)-Cys(6) binuclear cluster domain n=1 Tax=Rhizoctonia solani TaxID=456999 RepID=A0A8H8NVF8_9AGAM|nr:Fungal Zn(2)-Cys(6) binuclear cluster domain [Rhizoctonia solani]QRW20075.1 Fungal Zn(2)-Cys(6) binuclear cluster domain [Rhizoctonia solani]
MQKKVKRRKKCDQSKPSCNSCLKGGYECLGYDYNHPRVKIHRDHSDASPITILPSDCLTTGLPNNSQDTTDARRDHVLTRSILGAALRYRARGSEPTPATDNSLAEGSLRDFNRSWPQDQSQSVTYSVPSTHQPAFARSSSSEAPRARNTEDTLIEEIGVVYRSIPPSIYDMQTVREDHFARVAREYALKAYNLWFLSSLPKIRDWIMNQTRGRRTVHVMYFGATTLQLLSQDPQNSSAIIKRQVDWIDRYGQKLATDVCGNSPPSDMIDCFNAYLELMHVLVNYVILDGISAYALLRTALPRFLSLVTDEPSLLVDQPNGSLAISFIRIIRSPRHELARFVGNNVTLSFLFGVPPLAEYAYESACDHGQLEWLHGVSIPLFQIISQVNSWRARSKVFLEDWQTLEQRALAWRSPYDTSNGPFVPESGSSEMAAVREGWRYVVLIYIYMLKPPAKVAPLKAGVAARLERQRAVVCKKLFLITGSHPWAPEGPQLGLFLYRLWHSAGAGGGPVTWDDYVQSRQAVAPI